jgi:poly [ADP-ribose] polymerase
MGRLSQRKSILRKQIEQLGGTIVKTIDKHTDVIISTQSYLSSQKGNKKLQVAQKFEIHIVPEEFLDDILNDRPVIVMEKLKISTWGILPHIRKRKDREKKKSSTSFKAPSKKFIPERVTMKLKDGAAVDPDSGKFLCRLNYNYR